MNELRKKAFELMGYKGNISARELAETLGIDVRQAGKIIKSFISKNGGEGVLPKGALKKKDKERRKTAYNGRKTFKGKIEGHQSGFAFFIPEAKDAEDVYIHPKNLGGAVHGDTVIASIEMYKGRKEAIVTQITERGTKTVVGVADIRESLCRIIPFSRNFTNDLIIRKPGTMEDGDVAVCKIDRYPTERLPAEGSVIEKLGHISDIGIDNKIILRKYELPQSFPKEAEAEAREIEKELLKTPLKKPTDFTKLFTVTIDGETAKDFDDAISVEEEKGRLTLYVHIADVSRFVPMGSALDREASRRGASVYFPQFAIPMLPEALSNGLCSLMPNEERYAVTVKILFDEEGKRIETSFYRSLIKSDRRLTYAYVNALLARRERDDSKELSSFLEKAAKLAEILNQRRKLEGGVDFDLPEPIFIFDPEGRVIDILPSERGFAERMIEFFMISANEAVADFLSANKVNALYRIHGEPDTKKIEIWLEAAKGFGLTPPSLEYPLTPQLVKELGVIASSSRYSNILNSMLVRSMMRAEYATENSGHFGLASLAYTHFTSPIRRYPDLLVHRALLHQLGLGPVSETLPQLQILAKSSSILERFAEDAEHDIGLFKKLEYLRANFQDVFEAYINRITPGGFFIYVEKLMMTGFIPFGSMNRRFTAESFAAVNETTGERYKIGDKIKAKVSDISLTLQRADFKLIRNKKGSEIKTDVR